MSRKLCYVHHCQEFDKLPNIRKGEAHSWLTVDKRDCEMCQDEPAKWLAGLFETCMMMGEIDLFSPSFRELYSIMADYQAGERMNVGRAGLLADEVLKPHCKMDRELCISPEYFAYCVPDLCDCCDCAYMGISGE